jgi:hypothetical protein
MALEYCVQPWSTEGPRMFVGTTYPTTGSWNVGDLVINTAPTSGGTWAWVCTTAGTTGGTWKTISVQSS